jgi:hypothetical protein
MFCAEWRRDRQRREHALGVARGPLQHLHAAHRAARDREQRLDAEPVEQHGLGPHHVANGDDGKIEPEHFAGLRIGRGRSGRAHAGAHHVRADDEIALRVDRFARPDHALPPARLPGDGVHVGDVLVAGERMADQHRVGAIGIERPIGLIRDLERRERHAGVELERRVRTKAHDRRMRMLRFAQTKVALVFERGLGHLVLGSPHRRPEGARSLSAERGLDSLGQASVNVYFVFRPAQAFRIWSLFGPRTGIQGAGNSLIKARQSMSRSCGIGTCSGFIICACPYRRTGIRPGSSPGQAFAGTCARRAR